MKSAPAIERYQSILDRLSQLPRNMLRVQGADNISAFVLHELCQEACFNLNKAAYFIDNPDFNCLKGVAGFARNEAYAGEKNIWEDPTAFSSHMHGAPFNKQVREMVLQSPTKTAQGDTLFDALAKDLAFDQYAVCQVGSRHDNHGVLIYEKPADDMLADPEYLMNGLSLLGFCPVF